MSALLNLDEHPTVRHQCLRVWDNTDSWHWSCGHHFATAGPHGRICGRESFGFETRKEAEESAKTHHWVFHTACAVPA